MALDTSESSHACSSLTTVERALNCSRSFGSPPVVHDCTEPSTRRRCVVNPFTPSFSGEGPMTLKRKRSRVEVMDGGGGEGVVGRGLGGEAFLELVKQAHQLIDFGYDAVLLGERWDWHH